MEETHTHHKKDNKLLYAVVILGILLVASSAYTLMKINEVSDKTTKLNSDYANRLNNLETGFNTLAKKVDAKLEDLTVPLTLYYNSQCQVCKNEEVVLFANNLKQQLSQQGILVKLTDVAGNPTEPQRLGIPRLPAFYATRAMLEKSNELNSVLRTMENEGKFTPVNVVDGLALVPPGVTEIITNNECKNNDAVKLDEFYTETCPYCVRISDENGTIVNPPDYITPEGISLYTQVTDEALNEIEKEFGSKLNTTRQCVSLRGQAENYYNLGVNKSDSELCLEKYSEEEKAEADLLWNKYFLGNIPTFVLDCKYAFTLVIGKPIDDQIRENICTMRPDICASLPRTTPTESPTTQASPTASASPAATASPSTSPTPAA